MNLLMRALYGDGDTMIKEWGAVGEIGIYSGNRTTRRKPARV
jgi:hypothetical protein